MRVPMPLRHPASLLVLCLVGAGCFRDDYPTGCELGTVPCLGNAAGDSAAGDSAAAESSASDTSDIDTVASDADASDADAGTPAGGDFVVPYSMPAAPANLIWKPATKIESMDVFVDFELSGSMGAPLNEFRSKLSTYVHPELKKFVPDLAMGFASFIDYPLCGHGFSGDYPVRVVAITSTDVSSVQTAMTGLTIGAGADGSNSALPSLKHLVTGAALTWTGGAVATVIPPTGTFGAANLRTGSLPVVVLVSSNQFHTPADYCSDVNSPPDNIAVGSALALKGAAVMTVTPAGAATALKAAEDLSDAASSARLAPTAYGGSCGLGQCCTGADFAARAPRTDGTCRLTYEYGTSGKNIPEAIVSGARAIATGWMSNVTFSLTVDPTNPKDGSGVAVDATKFVKHIRVLSDGDTGAGCAAHKGWDDDTDGTQDTFIDLPVGKGVCVEVVPNTNTIAKPGSAPLVFKVTLSAVSKPSLVNLAKRTLTFVVPPA